MSARQDLLSFFSERFREVDTYLDLLAEIEVAARSGPPRIAETGHVISSTHQKILHSSVYLQLYNIIEATVSRCVDSVCLATHEDGKWRPENLNGRLQQEWIRAIARTHTEMSAENRLKQAVVLSNHLISGLPVQEFKIAIGGGGNWDDHAIEDIGKRVGCRLGISPSTLSAVKRPFRDDLGALKLVKDRRNTLAHGAISFVDCADGVSVAELRLLSQAVQLYLAEVIDCFVSYIENFDFLQPNSKPNRGN